MLELTFDFRGARFDVKVPTKAVKKLAEQLGELYESEAKLAIIKTKAITTGRTYKSIRNELVLDSPSRNEYRRRIVADKSFDFIDKGRRKGAKMPVHVVPGVTKRGGKLFVPFPELITWFNILGIPRSAWFLILRSMKRKGIKPKNIRRMMLKSARAKMREFAFAARDDIAKHVIVTHRIGSGVR